VGEIRGRGLIGALELVADKATGKPFADGSVGAKAQQFCQDNGLILRTVAGSSLAFCPPLIISREQIDEMIDKTRRALQSTLDFCHREKLLG
jgi:4-aminobutyrate--pyruvate transaminase